MSIDGGRQFEGNISNSLVNTVPTNGLASLMAKQSIALWSQSSGRVHIHTTGKKYGIYFISAIFFLFCGVCRVYLYLVYIPTSRYYFLEVNSQSIAKWTANVQEQLFWSFFFIRRCLECLLSHCQIAAISVRVLIRDIMHNIIVYLPPRLVRSAGDYYRGDLA